MPVFVSANLVPRNGQKWPVLEDTYLRGGMRVVANAAARDQIYLDGQSRSCLKPGCLVLTQDDQKLWIFTQSNTFEAYLERVKSYKFETIEPQLAWVINHNFNSKFFTYSCFSDSGNAVIPGEVTITSLNEVVLSFSTPVAGFATFMFVP